MSTVLTPTITTAGLQAVFNATHSGLQARIAAVALGEGSYTPTQDHTSLQDERNRLTIVSGKLAAPNQIHMSVIDDSDKSFWVREAGFFLEDGTLFAIYSDPENALAYKSPEVDLLLAFDLALYGVPPDSVTIVDQGADLNILIAPELARMARAQVDNMSRHLKQKFELMDHITDAADTTPGTTPGVVNPPIARATTGRLGGVRFSTDSEATAGSVNNEAITPRGVRLHCDARYALTSHSHPWNEIDGKPSDYPPASHNHDDRYLRLANAPRAVYVDVRSTGNTSSAGTALNWAMAIHPDSGFRNNDHIRVVYKNRQSRRTGNGTHWWTDEYIVLFIKIGAWIAIANSSKRIEG